MMGYAAISWLSSLAGLKHGRHALMNEIDRLEWTKHYLELNDMSCLVPLDDVYTVDQDAVDLRLELKHGVCFSDDLAHVAKGRIDENLEGGTQVSGRYPLASLWRVYDRGNEHCVLVEQSIEPAWVPLLNEPMPDLHGMFCHLSFPSADVPSTRCGSSG
jgi:hypothetical protein